MSYFESDTSMPLRDDRQEMIRIGKVIFTEKSSTYNKRMMNIIHKTLNEMMPNASEFEKEDAMYASIYDYWVYGNNISEEFYFDFPHKTRAEKLEYITFRLRYLYMNHLNSAETRHLLDNKWDAYNLMKPYYRREAILIRGQSDFDEFSHFTERHPEFVVKPVGLGAAAGVHKESISNNSQRACFNKILAESNTLSNQYPWGDATAMMIEELIPQDEKMASLHPASLQSIRLVTVKIGNEVHIWYPRMDIGRSGSFLINGAAGGIMAVIDPRTGVVIKKGIPESGETFEVHPDTGVRILGFQVPKWYELIDMATYLMLNVVKDTCYVGWDMALTPNGWCVVEGNWAGEFVGDQLGYGRGLKREFEELIGWKPTQTFWWQK